MLSHPVILGFKPLFTPRPGPMKPRGYRPALALLCAVAAAGCGGPSVQDRGERTSGLWPEIVLPARIESVKGMRLLRDSELAEAIVGRKVAGGAVSHYDNYVPGGVYIKEQDLGIVRQGGWAIGQDALCSMVHGDPRPSCSRFYRAADGALFEAFPGREGELLPVRTEGPVTIR